ncbi:MAG: phosphodiester glycosidase family protein [Clostridia bacterium]|nr:phosphodiester glycosidase family protein [Clostridia bacterium]
MRHKTYKILKPILTSLICIVSSLAILVSGYIAIVWGNIPYITDLRDLYIETAMTTFTHQWLATSFFPAWLVEDVMSKQERPDLIEVPLPSPTDENVTPSPTPTPVPDILGQEYLTVGEKDKNGNKVLVNDIEEGIVIVQVSGSTFEGKLVLIDDPSRVFLGVTDRKGVWGQTINKMMKRYNAVVGINASGFEDPDGHGKGGVVNGRCYSEGESWGIYNATYSSIGFNKDNKLIVGDYYEWDKHNIRDGIQFTPVIISNGKVVLGRGYGLQPRTVIAQASNGVVMFLVIDGRALHSVGATYKDCANILLKYNAVSAAACDGGSSSVLWYKNSIQNVPSTPMKDTGRYLPNAFLVRSKSAT